MLVCVYGTLKSGERNHALIQRIGARLVGAAQTEQGHFVMVQFNSSSTPGRFTPGVFAGPIDGATSARILGEVYDVDEGGLEALDRLENVGVNYDRVSVPILGQGDAQMYIKRRDGRDFVTASPFIVCANGAYNWTEKPRN